MAWERGTVGVCCREHGAPSCDRCRACGMVSASVAAMRTRARGTLERQVACSSIQLQRVRRCGIDAVGARRGGAIPLSWVGHTWRASKALPPSNAAGNATTHFGAQDVGEVGVGAADALGLTTLALNARGNKYQTSGAGHYYEGGDRTQECPHPLLSRLPKTGPTPPVTGLTARLARKFLIRGG